MIWLRLVFAILTGLGASSSPALTPPLDNRPGFFAGDWIASPSEIRKSNGGK